MTDPRITDLVRLDGGEGWGTFTAAFEGQPAFVIDGRVLNKFARQGEWLRRPIMVRVFDDWESRDWYVEQRRRRLEDLHQKRPEAIVLPFVRR